MFRGESGDWRVGVQNELTEEESDFFIGLTSSEDGIFHIERGGNVGIGTTSPTARLDVRGTVNIGSDGAGHDVSVFSDSSGARLYWSEDKMSLRAGRDTDGTYWTPGNIGDNSLAAGCDAISSGDYSAAFGYRTEALGDYSLASGYFTDATGRYAVAMGNQTTAAGWHSLAMGQATEATGEGSFAMGYNSHADGIYSSAIGYGIRVYSSAGYSTARGYGSSTDGAYAVAMGHYASADGEVSVALGRDVTAGPADHTIVLGSGVNSSNVLQNNVANSLMVGFDTTTPTLFVGGSSHRVGVGTTSPDSKLHIETATGRVLNVESNALLVGQVVNIERTNTIESGSDVLQLKTADGSDDDSQFIECQRGSDVEFKVNGNGNVYADGTFSPGGADMAEMIAVSPGAGTAEPGDVMVIDPGSSRATQKSSEPRSSLVAGIYSTRPGFVGSERDWDKLARGVEEEQGTYTMQEMAAQFNEVPLAVVGIVPCKVSAENGSIRPGDLLVTSGTPGHAMRDDRPSAGTILGKALEPMESGTGLIRVLVTLQ